MSQTQDFAEAFETNPKGNWIETYTGVAFFPGEPKPDDINIDDIAHALSQKCRFNGHCQPFYSVAEHCLRVLDYFETLHPAYPNWTAARLRVLLHDAAEIYTSDVPAPVKPLLPSLKPLDKQIMKVVHERFDCSDENINLFKGYDGHSPTLEDFENHLRVADLTLLATEARDLGMNKRQDWYLPYPPLVRRIVPLLMQDAKRLFLDKFHEIK